MIHTSNHAKARIKERMGITSDRIAELAIIRGIRRENTTGGLRRYLDKLYYGKGSRSSIYVYNNSVFIFICAVLVTVISLPTKYHNTVANIKRKGG